MAGLVVVLLVVTRWGEVHTFSRVVGEVGVLGEETSLGQVGPDGVREPGGYGGEVVGRLQHLLLLLLVLLDGEGREGRPMAGGGGGGGWRGGGGDG